MIAKKETPRDFRRKIKRAEESRNLWKDKHQKVQYELKKARAKMDAVKQSRNKWHEKCKHISSMSVEIKRDFETFQEKNKVLNKENKQLQEEIEDQRKLMEVKKKQQRFRLVDSSTFSFVSKQINLSLYFACNSWCNQFSRSYCDTTNS